MALTLTTAARNAACDAITALINAGSGTTGGTIVTTTSGSTILVTNVFSATSFGGATVGVATANAIADGTAVATGTAALAYITNRDAATIMSGLTVGTSASNVNLSSTSISTNDVVSLTAGTMTMPAS